MPHEIASLLLRRSVGALAHHHQRCSGCQRVPLAGETMHQLASERLVCQLCLARLPEGKRDTVATLRVHVGDRRLTVAPHAA